MWSKLLELLTSATQAVENLLYSFFVPPSDVSADELDAMAMLADEWDIND